MNGEIQGQIQKFIFNLSNGDYAKANSSLKKVVNEKIGSRYKEQLEQIKKNSKKQ